MRDTKAFLNSLTNHPGVYQMLDEDGVVLYVGKAKNLKKRITSYFRLTQKDTKTLALMSQMHDINVTITRSETEALLLECNLIKQYQPHYNVLLRDDKGYPYILLTTNEIYPRIDIYRGIPKKDGNSYFGPYPNSAAVRETIRLIQKVFQIRTCSDNYFASRTRPCLHYQIGLCSGSCTGIISPEDYQQHIQHAMLFLRGKNQEIVEAMTQKMEQASKALHFELAATLRDQITQLREIQQRQYISSTHGNADVIGFAMRAGLACIQLLVIRDGRILGSRAYFPAIPAHASTQEILSAFITQHYLNQQAPETPKDIIMTEKIPDQGLLASALSEYAKHKVTIVHTVRGERKKWLETATASAQQSVASQLVTKANTKERLAALQALLNLSRPPKRIECFDISHSMGEATVASCVVFDSQGPAKSDYRRFNIENITPGDDFAAMKQALTRRYKHTKTGEEKLPDILLIDGGLGQLHIAEQVFAALNITNIILIGVAKGAGRKPGLETLHIPGQEPMHLDSDALALHLIQQIRDEAHRFAITAHRHRRDKKRRTSTLESIEGIGAKRRRDLLRYFGGIQAVNRASLEELAKVPGISQSLAKRIFEAIHNTVV